jgi:hypothetical protein
MYEAVWGWMAAQTSASSLNSELGVCFPQLSTFITNCEQRKLSNSIGGGSLYGGRARPYDSGSARRALPHLVALQAALGEFRGALKVSLPNTAETVNNTAKSVMLKICPPSLRPKNRWPSTHLRASNFQINQIGVSLFMEMETGVDRGQSTEDKFTRAIERQTSKAPSSLFLGLAIGSMAASLILKIAKQNHWALFVGQWAAPFLIIGNYNKMVKQHGSDAQNLRAA